MKFNHVIVSFVLCMSFLLFSHPTLAQGFSGANNHPDVSAGCDTGNIGNSMSNCQVDQLAKYVDDAHTINRKQIKHPPTREELIARAQPLLKKLNLKCELVDIALVGIVNEKVDGKSTQTNAYEIACSDGIGYFISGRSRLTKSLTIDPTDLDNVSAMSCFAAEGARSVDESKGIKSDAYCQLPENADIKLMAKKIMSDAGISCNTTQIQWFGVSSAAQLDYTEVKCEDDKGYLLRTALPGASVTTSVLTCEEAAKRSLDCKMTKVAAVPKLPTIETFKDFLAHTAVACAVEQVHFIGQESIKKRWVVEFQCPQQPKGLVAYIPLEDNANKFETIDCAEAAKRKLSCKLTNVKN